MHASHAPLLPSSRLLTPRLPPMYRVLRHDTASNVMHRRKQRLMGASSISAVEPCCRVGLVSVAVRHAAVLQVCVGERALARLLVVSALRPERAATRGGRLPIGRRTHGRRTPASAIANPDERCANALTRPRRHNPHCRPPSASNRLQVLLALHRRRRSGLHRTATKRGASGG